MNRDSKSIHTRDDDEEKAEEPGPERTSTESRPKTLVNLQIQLDAVEEQIRRLNTRIETNGPSVELRKELSGLEEQKKDIQYRIGVKNVETLI